MKTDRTPSELIDYIGEIIRERQQKSLPTFYTISIEQYDKLTPVAEKEQGYENFKKQILKYMTDFNLTGITIQLFSAKARNVTNPFQTFKVPLRKQNPTIVLSGPEKTETSEVTQLESSIPAVRYYDEKFEMRIRIMHLEMEKQTLAENINRITEKYEDKLKVQDSKNAEKIKFLEEEIKELEEDIAEFEREIAKSEKDKHNSFANLSLGSIGARMVENLAKSDFGTGVIKGLLGKQGYETLQGHLHGIEESKKVEGDKSDARIIPDEEETTDPRKIALSYIQKIGAGLPDMYLRMLYDIATMTEKNVKDLHTLWMVAKKIEQKKAEGTTEKKNEEDHTDDHSDDKV